MWGLPVVGFVGLVIFTYNLAETGLLTLLALHSACLHELVD